MVRLVVRRWRVGRRSRAEHPGPVPPAPVPAGPSGEGPAPQVVAGVPDIELLARSTVLTDARQVLHFPIARAVRAIQLAADHRAQYEAVLDAGEATTLTLGISAIAWLDSIGVFVPSLTRLGNSFQRGGVSLGRWLAVLNDVRPVAASTDRVAPPGLREATSRDKDGGPLADLDLLLQERNKWAHGARPRDAIEAGRRVLELGPVLERALHSIMPFAHSAWLQVQSGSFRRGGTFSMSALRAMGDHPEFERTQFESTTPLLDETFYLMSARGPIELSPLLALRYCDACGKPEMFYADRFKGKHGVALKSFANGHVVFDPGLTAPIEDLFGLERMLPPTQLG
jgi:hypothetical protein